MRINAPRVLIRVMAVTALSVTALSMIAFPANSARAETPGLLGVPARVFFEEKRLGGPFYTPSDPDIEGWLIDRNETALIIRQKDTEERLEVPLDSIARLDVSRGQSGRPILGALVGFGVGGLVGGALPVEESQAFLGDLDDSFTRFEHVVVGAFLGTVAGVVIGSTLKSEDWEEVSPQDLRWGLAPPLGPDGDVSLGLQLAFR